MRPLLAVLLVSAVPLVAQQPAPSPAPAPVPAAAPAAAPAPAPAPAPTAAPTAAPAAAAAPAPVVLTATQEQRIIAVGKQATAYFMAFKADSLAAMFASDALERIGGVAGISQLLAQVQEHGGAPEAIVEQKLTRRRGRPQFWTEIKYSNMLDDTLVTRWIIDVDGKIVGAGINPKAAAPEPDPPR